MVKRTSPIRVVFLVVVVGLSACTYQGYIEQPATIKATWYSYLAGDDIRRTCVPNALPRFRAVHNANYDEQLRTYEVVALDDGGARLRARVLGPMRAVAVIRNPLDVQDPWRWTVAETRLTPQEFATFQERLAESGWHRPLSEPMELLSTEFYWIVTGCRAGEFTFNAWRFGTDRYAALTFPEFLLARDETGVALNPPRPVSPRDRMRNYRPVGARSSGEDPYVFAVRVGPDGPMGLLAPR